MIEIPAMLVAVAGGWLCRRRQWLSVRWADRLNRAVLWICLPALVLARVPGLELRAELLVLAVMPWLLTGIAATAVLASGRLLGWPRPVTGAVLLAMLGNTSFLGFPLIDTLLGPQAVQLAAVYDQFGTFLLLSSYGVLVLAIYGGQSRPTFAGAFNRLVRFPPFLALLLALLLPGPLPPTLRSVFELLAMPLLPMVAFALGLHLRLRLPEGRRGPLGVGLAIKLLAMPAIATALLMAWPPGPDVFRVAVLEAAMPPMFTAGAMAVAARLEPELSSALVGYGLFAGVATVCVWAWWLG
ncbi:AEC family transporter [Pseudofulvimonas gallinarii]|nr:AEC family transporter [Pseudofulvimonas gallinarii]